jgi:hypothetical protein
LIELLISAPDSLIEVGPTTFEVFHAYRRTADDAQRQDGHHRSHDKARTTAPHERGFAVTMKPRKV